MSPDFKIYIKLLFILFAFLSCKKDGRMAVLNLKSRCMIASDTSWLTGNNGYCIYEFEENSNRLKIARNIVGNGVLLHYREVYYLNSNQPDKSITYINANEFYETRFVYMHGTIYPSKTELYYTNKLNGITGKKASAYSYRYDINERLIEVIFGTPQNGDQEYTLHIFYNDKDNVSRLEYEMTSGPQLPNNVIRISAYDDKPNPYSKIAYWPFLMLPATWDNNDPEPIITALSKNNPLDYSIGNFKREMTYIYNQNNLPLIRLNINKNQNGQSTFKESFNYRCP